MDPLIIYNEKYSNSFYILLFSCTKKETQSCVVMEYGTFDVYQRDIKVGTFYRKDSLQVETYVGKKITGLTKVRQLSKCSYMLRSYWPKKDIDTIHFTANYTIGENNEIMYEMTPTFLETKSKLSGKILKVSDTIDSKILKMFGKQ